MYPHTLDIETLSEQAELPLSTTRKYIDRFADFFTLSHKIGKRKMYPSDAVNTLKTIRHLYGQGYKKHEIQTKLSSQVKHVTSPLQDIHDTLNLLLYEHRQLHLLLHSQPRKKSSWFNFSHVKS